MENPASNDAVPRFPSQKAHHFQGAHQEATYRFLCGSTTSPPPHRFVNPYKTYLRISGIATECRDPYCFAPAYHFKGALLSPSAPPMLARGGLSAVAGIRLVRCVSQRAHERIDDVSDSVYPLIGLKGDSIFRPIWWKAEPCSVCQGIPQGLAECAS